LMSMPLVKNILKSTRTYINSYSVSRKHEMVFRLGTWEQQLQNTHHGS
jgi:hypothetical protein